MEYRVNIKDLKNPEDLAKLVSSISDIAEKLDVIYTTTAPNGSVSARQGRIALYNNSGTYEQWQNVDGGTTWQRIDYSMPSGTILMYGGSTVPTGWLACDGTAVSRTTYAALFTAIGTTYGSGDGSTTFTLPNLTNKIPRGNTPGTGGGSDTFTLDANDLPVHTHPVGTLATASDGAHRHVINLSFGGGVSATREITHTDVIDKDTASVSEASGEENIGSAGAHTHTLSGATGNNTTTGTAIDTLPAYVSVKFIVKT